MPDDEWRSSMARSSPKRLLRRNLRMQAVFASVLPVASSRSGAGGSAGLCAYHYPGTRLSRGAWLCPFAGPSIYSASHGSLGRPSGAALWSDPMLGVQRAESSGWAAPEGATVHEAATMGAVATLRLLLESGESPDVPDEGSLGVLVRTPLHVMCRNVGYATRHHAACFELLRARFCWVQTTSLCGLRWKRRVAVVANSKRC